MIKIVCDRCGKDTEKHHEYYAARTYDITKYNPNAQHRYDDDRESVPFRESVHLCPDCERAFEHFLEGSDNK